MKRRYGKFTEYAYFDDLIKSVQFYYNGTSGDVVIVAPHFWDYAGNFIIIYIF